jgi:hypothetical protein
MERALSIEITADARTFVELSTPEVLALDGDGESSIAWDLAFSGREIFTNSGASGPGNARGFGPLSPPTFLSDTAPGTPVLFEDRAGGAFLDWYDYDSALLYSRFHVYGVQDGARFYKVQLLSYYGGPAGTGDSAMYRLRYAEVSESGAGETLELSNIDATAGGPDGNGSAGCLDLESGDVQQLSLGAAGESEAWHLCFHRDSVLVNGGVSGPGGVSAVDLDSDQTPLETAADVQERSASSELARFDAVDFDVLGDTALVFREDGVVTPFGALWLEPGSDPLAPADDVWLVVAADGASHYLVAFDALDGDPAEEPATLDLRVKSVRAR